MSGGPLISLSSEFGAAVGKVYEVAWGEEQKTRAGTEKHRYHPRASYGRGIAYSRPWDAEISLFPLASLPLDQLR